MCGRFRPWADLVFKWAYESSVTYPSEVEWFECRPGHGCAGERYRLAHADWSETARVAEEWKEHAHDTERRLSGCYVLPVEVLTIGDTSDMIPERMWE
jgi:hypothetical protein